MGLKQVVLDVIDDGGDKVFARRREFYQRLGFQSLMVLPGDAHGSFRTEEAVTIANGGMITRR